MIVPISGMEMPRTSLLASPKAVSDFVTERAKEVVLKDGFHVLMFMVIGKDRMRLFSIPPNVSSQNDGKAAASALVRAQVKDLVADGVAVIAEAWVTKLDPDTKTISRREMLVTTVEWRDGRQLCRYVEMIRDATGELSKLVEDDKDTVEATTSDNFGGQLAGWFKEE